MRSLGEGDPQAGAAAPRSPGFGSVGTDPSPSPSEYSEAFIERFMVRVEKLESGCWGWSGAHVPEGYAHVWDGGRARAAHRVAYELFVGVVPEGLELDHLCRNRGCVNPDHLEAVTHRVNTLRGNTITAAAKAKTHCPQGHPYDDENTTLYRGARYCRACRRVPFRKQKRAS